MRAGNLDFMISRFPIRKFPRIFLMRTWVSDPEPIRKFLRNFLLRSRKKIKLFLGLASQPASGPGPMDQGRTQAQWPRAMGRGPWTRAGPRPRPGPGPDPGPMGQAHGPGPGPMDAHGPGHHFGGRGVRGGEAPRLKTV